MSLRGADFASFASDFLSLDGRIKIHTLITNLWYWQIDDDNFAQTAQLIIPKSHPFWHTMRISWTCKNKSLGFFDQIPFAEYRNDILATLKRIPKFMILHFFSPLIIDHYTLLNNRLPSTILSKRALLCNLLE